MNEEQQMAAPDPMVQELIPFMNPEIIAAESLYDLIDEDMKYPYWD